MKSNHKNFVHLVGSYTYCRMMHGAYNVKKKIFEISGWTDTSLSPNNESSKNTNVKPDINKLTTNNRCQYLENVMTRNETSEQNPNGYCNVDFVFRLESNICFLYLWHDTSYGTVNLYLFLKYIYSPTSNLLPRCSLKCVESVTFCAMMCDVYSHRSGK